MEDVSNLYPLMDEAGAFNILFDYLAPDLARMRGEITDWYCGRDAILYAINELISVPNIERTFFPPRTYTSFLSPRLEGMAQDFMSVIFPTLEAPNQSFEGELGPT